MLSVESNGLRADIEQGGHILQSIYIKDRRGKLHGLC
jgi:hypothetical protein